MWPKTTHAVTSLAKFASHYCSLSEVQSACSIERASTLSKTRFIDYRKKTIVRAYLTHPFTWPNEQLHVPLHAPSGNPPKRTTFQNPIQPHSMVAECALHAHACFVIPITCGVLRSTRHSPTNLQADPREEDKRANSTGVRSDSSNAQTHATHGQTRTRIVTALPLTPAALCPKALHRQSNRPCK